MKTVTVIAWHVFANEMMQSTEAIRFFFGGAVTTSLTIKYNASGIDKTTMNTDNYLIGTANRRHFVHCLHLPVSLMAASEKWVPDFHIPDGN